MLKTPEDIYTTVCEKWCKKVAEIDVRGSDTTARSKDSKDRIINDLLD